MRNQTLDAKVLAEAELDLLSMYHIQNSHCLDEYIKKLRKAQFGVDISDESIEAFADAIKFHFLSQEAHRDGFESRVDVYREQAQEYMQKHYEGIVEKLK